MQSIVGRRTLKYAHILRDMKVDRVSMKKTKIKASFPQNNKKLSLIYYNQMMK